MVDGFVDPLAFEFSFSNKFFKVRSLHKIPSIQHGSGDLKGKTFKVYGYPGLKGVGVEVMLVGTKRKKSDNKK